MRGVREAFTAVLAGHVPTREHSLHWCPAQGPCSCLEEVAIELEDVLIARLLHARHTRDCE